MREFFNFSSLVFVTSTGLVVGYVGEGAAGRGVIVGGGGVSPTVVNGKHVLGYTGARKSKRGLNGQLIEWREVFQHQKLQLPWKNG